MKNHPPRPQDEFQRLRQRAESSLLAQKNPQPEESDLDFLEVLHELEVYQVELEMQNEEIRNSRELLENSRDDYFNLYEFAPVAFFTVNAKGIITKANISATALVNLERKFFLNSSFLQLVIPGERARFSQLQKAVRISGDPKSCELTLQVKGRKPIPVQLEMLSLNNAEDDEPQYLLAINDISQQKYVEQRLEEIIRERTRDLTEMNQLLMKEIEHHKQTAQVLKENEKKFRTVSDYTCAWEIWRAPDKTWLYSSPFCKKISGYEPEEFTSNPNLFLTLVHPEDHERYRHEMKNIFLSESEEMMEYRLVAKDGKIRWVEHRCRPVYDDNHEFLGRRASLIDITSRKQMEKELQESEQRFRLALDAASDGLWDHDLETGEVYYGDNWYAILGYSEEDGRQGTLTWKNLLHPDDAEKAISTIDNYIAGQSDQLRQEFRLRNKKGGWTWILSKGKIVAWDENGKPTRLVGTHTDFTERKTMELALKQHQETLEENVRQRTAELEEINTALNVLLRKREKDKDILEANISKNVTELIDPYFEKLKGSSLTPWQNGMVHLLHENLQELTSPFMRNVDEMLIRLSPMELRVAGLVRGGRSSQEIADLLQISIGTVNIHRKNVRKKIGVNNQKVNLQVALQAFMKE